MILLFLIAKNFYICIFAPGEEEKDCGSWLETGEKIDLLLENKTDFSSLTLGPSDVVNLGIGSVPDLPIDLGTLSNDHQDIVMIVNTTRPSSTTITFDFQVTQFDDLRALTFNNLQLKPHNRTLIQTTSTTHSYGLIFNNCNFLAGYIFESEIFRPMATFNFAGVTIVEYFSIWGTSIYHTPILENFFFTTRNTLVYPTIDRTESTDINFTTRKMTGQVNLITDYFTHPKFILNSTEDLPEFGFSYTAPVDAVTFSGGWNENITLKFDGIKIIATEDKNKIIINAGEGDAVLPISAQMAEPTGQYTVEIVSPEETVDLSVPWNMTIPFIFTRNDKTTGIYIEKLLYLSPDARISRADITKKLFIVGTIEIFENIQYSYPGRNDIYIKDCLRIDPGATMTVDNSIRFDKNTAIMELVWDSHIGFPYVYISQAEYGTAKALPNIYLSDYEPIDRIAEANETYANILGVPQKIMCGNNMKVLEPSKFQFKSINPSFQEGGVWDYYWDNKTNPVCLYVNMTGLPEVPIIPVPSPSKDPAAVEQNAMIGMIVTFICLAISAVLAYFSKYLPQNRRDRAKELAEANRGDEPETDDEEPTEATKFISDSDLTDHYESFEQNLSDFSLDTTMEDTGQNAAHDQEYSEYASMATTNNSYSTRQTGKSFETDGSDNSIDSLDAGQISPSSKKMLASIDTPLLDNQEPVEDDKSSNLINGKKKKSG